MSKTNVKGEQMEVNNVSMIRNMAVGYDKDSFVIAINKKEDDSFEGVYSIPADKLNDIIAMLFQAGVELNKKLLNNELSINNCTNYDWIVIVAFYTALHLLQGEMSKSGIHTRTHTDRDVMVARNRAFINIRSKYKMLHDMSIVARYSAQCLDKKKAQQALQLLADIEKEIVL